MWLAPADPDSQAWAAWKIASYEREGGMDIQIGDCFRSISLGLYNKKDERKIRRLIKFLEDAVQKHVEERDAES
jgi:hypothetical protein